MESDENHSAPAPTNHSLSGRARGWIVLGMVGAIRAYQFALRPFLLGNCKFVPSCSEYAIESAHVHGPLRGGWLALRRVLRCHPFGGGGFDPVPPGSTGADTPEREQRAADPH